MASAIRSAGALRYQLPRLLSSTTRSTPRAIEEERQSLVRRAGLTAIGDARLFSSNAVGRFCTPCKFNWGHRQHMGKSFEGQLASISTAVKKDALGWRMIREQLENQTKRAEMYKRQDRVVGYASAAVALALVAANMQSG